MAKYLQLALAGLFLIGMAGCNTIAGAGEDIETAGETLEEEAED